MTAVHGDKIGQAATGDLKLFLAGDVMTGRGIDQILPHPASPELYEPYVKDARDYVRLAERKNGTLDKPVAFDYPWGDALPVLRKVGVHARIVNLETAVTGHDAPWPGKGIHYRMDPAHVPLLTALGVDVCVLANNHVLDWQPAGLQETLATLHAAGVQTAGAGGARRAAERPAIIESAGCRLLVFAFGIATSGISPAWAAGENSPGVNFLPDLTAKSLKKTIRIIGEHALPDDRVIVSIHWGGNWGYEVSAERQAFARALIEETGVDLVHGHSSHHPQGIEVFRERLILYGCGDFLNDYEGITGRESYRPDLTLMYLADLDTASGALRRLTLIPLQIHQMRLRQAGEKDIRWLAATLTRYSKPLGGGTTLALQPADDSRPMTLALRW